MSRKHEDRGSYVAVLIDCRCLHGIELFEVRSTSVLGLCLSTLSWPQCCKLATIFGARSGSLLTQHRVMRMENEHKLWTVIGELAAEVKMLSEERGDYSAS